MNETIKTDIMEQIETTLFFTSALNNIIFDILEDMELTTINEFIEIFEYKTTDSIQADFIKWELLKNYANIENINQVNTDNILQEFYNDIKKVFNDIVGA